MLPRSTIVKKIAMHLRDTVFILSFLDLSAAKNQELLRLKYLRVHIAITFFLFIQICGNKNISQIYRVYLNQFVTVKSHLKELYLAKLLSLVQFVLLIDIRITLYEGVL